MKTKNFLIGGLAGGITDFLLGWLFYGILFADSFPQPAEESSNTLILIFLGCITFGLFIAYVFTKWAQITTAATGVKAGALIGLFLSLYMSFFEIAMNSEATIQTAGLGIVISIIISAIVGAVVGLVNGKLE